MIKLDFEGNYKAERVRSGENARGAWELIVVKEEGKGKKVITIWTDNAPSGVREGEYFSVKNISLVKYGARRDNNGNWRDDVSINATVEPVEGSSVADGFEDIDFDIGDDPFANNNMFSADDPFSEKEELPF